MSYLFIEKRSPGKIGEIIQILDDVVVYNVYDVSPFLRKWKLERKDSTLKENFIRHLERGDLELIK